MKEENRINPFQEDNRFKIMLAYIDSLPFPQNFLMEKLLSSMADIIDLKTENKGLREKIDLIENYITSQYYHNVAVFATGDALKCENIPKSEYNKAFDHSLEAAKKAQPEYTRRFSEIRNGRIVRVDNPQVIETKPAKHPFMKYPKIEVPV